MWWIIAVCIIIICVMIAYIIYGNVVPEKTEYTVYDKRLPESADGKIIVHLSDLQNTNYRGFYERISALVASACPNAIVFTGDIIDRRKYNIDNVAEFLAVLRRYTDAPMYFVTGNHEAWYEGGDDEIISLLRMSGVTVLRDEAIKLFGVNLIGIDDMGYFDDMGFFCSGNTPDEEYEKLIDRLAALKTDGYNILLTHRPELMDEYAEAKIELVLAGHAHGGQYRLPLIGALYAPHQGIFPKYDAGEYDKDGTKMILNRGLGSGKCQFRTFNRPEVGVIILRKTK